MREEATSLLINGYDHAEQYDTDGLYTSSKLFTTYTEVRNLSNIKVKFVAKNSRWVGTLSPGKSKVNHQYSYSCSYSSCIGRLYEFYRISGELLCSGKAPDFTQKKNCISMIFDGKNCSLNNCTR